jgi:ElaA protein
MNNTTLSFSIFKFDALSTAQLYEILHLRAAVFIMEQDCVYQDIDGLDQHGWHICGYLSDELICYARILPKGLSYPDAIAICRVVTKTAYRGQGLAHALMTYVMKECQKMFPNTLAKLSSQSYVTKFYEQHGFKKYGEEYLEDGIPHHAMRLQL